MARKPLEKMFLKPGPFGSVRDPVTFKMVPPEGEWKPKDMYWLRKVAMKDLIDATPSQKMVAVKEQKPDVAEMEPVSASKKKGELK